MCQICGIGTGILSESVRFHTIILHAPDLWCGQWLPASCTTNVGVAVAHPIRMLQFATIGIVVYTVKK